MSAPIVSRRMERGILILFVVAATVMGLVLLLPAVRHAIGIAGGGAGFELLTTAPVPFSGGAIDSATFQSAWVTASGLSTGTVAMLVLGVVIGGLTQAVVVGSIALFALLLMWRRPFHRALIAATLTAGAALLIGSILSGGLGGLGRMMAASELNPVADDVFIVGFSFDPAPLFAGVAVLALSFVFERGTRLQRDTEGLV